MARALRRFPNWYLWSPRMDFVVKYCSLGAWIYNVPSAFSLSSLHWNGAFFLALASAARQRRSVNISIRDSRTNLCLAGTEQIVAKKDESLALSIFNFDNISDRVLRNAIRVYWDRKAEGVGLWTRLRSGKWIQTSERPIGIDQEFDANHIERNSVNESNIFEYSVASGRTSKMHCGEFAFAFILRNSNRKC